jgi:hypothetical protein
MPDLSRLLLSRFLAPAAGLVSLAFFTVIYFAAPGFYALVAKMLIFLPATAPFADWHWILMSTKCWSEGANVYFDNPCFPHFMGVAFNYPPLWLRLSFLGRAEPWNVQTAFPIVILFFLALATLPPPRTMRDQVILLLAAVSSGIWLGVERGNADILLFLLAVIALNLRVLSLPFRLAAYALLVLAGLLKLYPFAALIVALRERWAVFAAVGLASVAVLLAMGVVYHQELRWMAGQLPAPAYFDVQFGSTEFAVLLGVTVANCLQAVLHEPIATARAAGDAVTHLAPPFLLLIAMLGAVIVGRRCRLTSALAQLSERETGYLVVGSAMIVGCFFMVNSHIFRGMYLLLALPGLAAMSRQNATPQARWIFSTTCIAVPLVLWKPFFDMCLIVAAHWKSARGNNDDPYNAFPGLTPDYVLWLVNELAWWWIIIVLLAVLGAWVLRSDAWALLTRLLPAGTFARKAPAGVGASLIPPKRT